MYSRYIMRRTQIYLTEAQGRLLESRSKATGRTISELIRDAIDAAYATGRERTRAERVRIARAAVAAWTDLTETGAEYVKRLRGSRRARLDRGR
jgi:hypothetical protein